MFCAEYPHSKGQTNLGHVRQKMFHFLHPPPSRQQKLTFYTMKVKMNLSVTYFKGQIAMNEFFFFFFICA